MEPLCDKLAVDRSWLPAGELTRGQLCDRRAVFGLCVQGGHVAQCLATGGLELLSVLLRHFLQRLQTVCGESGANGVELSDTARGQRINALVRIRLQPGLTPEAGLEADAVVVFPSASASASRRAVLWQWQ